MTASKEHTTIIRVRIKQDDRGVYTATSPTVKGLLVVSKNFELLLDRLVPEAISDLFEASGQEIIVSRAREGQGESGETPFVLMPVAIARHALESAS